MNIYANSTFKKKKINERLVIKAWLGAKRSATTVEAHSSLLVPYKRRLFFSWEEIR